MQFPPSFWNFKQAAVCLDEGSGKTAGFEVYITASCVICAAQDYWKI